MDQVHGIHQSGIVRATAQRACETWPAALFQLAHLSVLSAWAKLHCRAERFHRSPTLIGLSTRSAKARHTNLRDTAANGKRGVYPDNSQCENSEFVSIDAASVPSYAAQTHWSPSPFHPRVPSHKKWGALGKNGCHGSRPVGIRQCASRRRPLAVPARREQSHPS